MKYISLTLALLNTIVFGLYFTDTTRIESYQWIITPMFIIYFTLVYLKERKKK